MLTAKLIVDELKKLNVTHVVGLPDNGTAAVHDILRDDPDVDVISVCREGEAFAIASGLYVGGKRPVVLIQCTGFLESGDAIRGTVVNAKIPLVALIGYRGYHKMSSADEWVDTAATFFEPTLKAWNIPYYIMKTDDEIKYISEAFKQAEDNSMPTAALIVGICK
ncbi:MAG: thiamine pyrophosphate-binding protein [Candidatus Poribacteria bacterium]